MTNNGLGFISVEIMSIFLFLKAVLIGISYLVHRISYPELYADLLSSWNINTLFMMLFYLTLGLLLWMKANRIAGFLLPKDKKDIECNTDFSKEDIEGLMVIGFFMVGLIAVGWCISMNYLIYKDIFMREVFRHNPFDYSGLIVSIIYLSMHMVVLLIGIGLVLKPRKLVIFGSPIFPFCYAVDEQNWSGLYGTNP